MQTNDELDNKLEELVVLKAKYEDALNRVHTNINNATPKKHNYWSYITLIRKRLYSYEHTYQLCKMKFVLQSKWFKVIPRAFHSGEAGIDLSEGGSSCSSG